MSYFHTKIPNFGTKAPILVQKPQFWNTSSSFGIESPILVQNPQLWYILEGLGMENVGTPYGHLTCLICETGSQSMIVSGPGQSVVKVVDHRDCGDLGREIESL
jgi:hypothetical protein